MKGILGRKIGMTGVFTEEGVLVPVTVIEVTPNVVTQIKTMENDGYEAVQIAFENKRENLTTKALKGHFAKAETESKRFLKEIRNADVSNYTLGQSLSVDIFEAGELVDVTARSKGKGFQGVIKRHNQSRGPMSHGSQYHRGVGSMGTMKPARVMPGKKLPGHMGYQMKTVQNLEVIKVDAENNLILVKGNVPGPKKSLVTIRTAIKNPNVKVSEKTLISYSNTEEEKVSE